MTKLGGSDPTVGQRHRAGRRSELRSAPLMAAARSALRKPLATALPVVSAVGVLAMPGRPPYLHGWVVSETDLIG